MLKVGENLQGMFYTYQVLIGDQWNEAVDPYRAVGVNGDRAYILDMASTDPKHWTEDKPPLPSPLDAVIYECMFVITPFIRTAE